MSQLFFTKAAAQRILSFARHIEAIRVFKGAVQVTYRTKNGRCSTFLSKTAFYNDFLTFRQQGAKQCTVKRWPAGSYENHYEVKSDSEKTYTVKLLAGLALCSCPDDEKQHWELGNKAKIGCKHILATLNSLGHDSLADYMNAMKAKACIA